MQLIILKGLGTRKLLKVALFLLQNESFVFKVYSFSLFHLKANFKRKEIENFTTAMTIVLYFSNCFLWQGFLQIPC